MKIFNWVHRKFHNKDESSDNVKMIKAEHGTGALLEQVALSDVIDDWGQGILAIGTFGYDPSPNSFNQQVQLIHMFGNEEELEILDKEGAREDDVEVENRTSVQGGEHNHLVLNASSKHCFSNKDIVCDHDQNATKSEITILPVDDLENLQCAKRGFTEKKERITLADLFLAECDEYIHHTEFGKDQGEVLNEPKSIKKAEGEVHSKFKVKKLIPLMKKEISNPSSHCRGIKKIHKMMTRMLKKKIHPEVDSKKQIKKQKPIKYGGNEVMEMASLLQTQDAIACP